MSDKKFKVVPHPEMGEPEVLEQKFGKYLIARFFKNPHRNDLVEEFVQFGQKDWAVVLPITEDNNVVIVRQFKQGCAKIIKELPAGTGSFLEKNPNKLWFVNYAKKPAIRQKKSYLYNHSGSRLVTHPPKYTPFLPWDALKNRNHKSNRMNQWKALKFPFPNGWKWSLAGKLTNGLQ